MAIHPEIKYKKPQSQYIVYQEYGFLYLISECMRCVVLSKRMVPQVQYSKTLEQDFKRSSAHRIAPYASAVPHIPSVVPRMGLGVRVGGTEDGYGVRVGGTEDGYGGTRTVQTQMQETAFLVQIVMKLRFLVLDFGA
eukprot:2937728-Rhodomonas_salina.1